MRLIILGPTNLGIRKKFQIRKKFAKFFIRVYAYWFSFGCSKIASLCQNSILLLWNDCRVSLSIHRTMFTIEYISFIKIFLFKTLLTTPSYRKLHSYTCFAHLNCYFFFKVILYICHSKYASSRIQQWLDSSWIKPALKSFDQVKWFACYIKSFFVCFSSIFLSIVLNLIYKLFVHWFFVSAMHFIAKSMYNVND